MLRFDVPLDQPKIASMRLVSVVVHADGGIARAHFIPLGADGKAAAPPVELVIANDKSGAHFDQLLKADAGGSLHTRLYAAMKAKLNVPGSITADAAAPVRDVPAGAIANADAPLDAAIAEVEVKPE